MSKSAVRYGKRTAARIRAIRHKPDPEPFLEAARRLGARPERCVVWEDSGLGIEAARRAGMQWIDVRSFHTPARVQTS